MNLERLQGMQIAVLQGGNSPEREVSLLSGATIVAGLCELGAQAFPVDPAEPDWMDKLTDIELAFIGLHGAGGEDGLMQGLLEMLEIPYTGSGVLGSALAMDKVVSKYLWRGLELPTAEFAELDEHSDWQAVIDSLGAAFVKPVTGGSSIGTAAVENAQELEAAFHKAAAFGDRVIAERLIRGPEYTVSILGGQALPAISMETDNAFYDYEAKYLSDDTRYLCPCGLDREEEEALARLALQAFSSLGCSVWGRVDLMRDADGSFNLLEVNTIPGMTSHSLVPMAAAALGIGLPELIGSIACLSLYGGEA
jgi:D-alanine-D-alanine ligase